MKTLTFPVPRQDNTSKPKVFAFLPRLWFRLELAYFRYSVTLPVYVMTKEERLAMNAIVLCTTLGLLYGFINLVLLLSRIDFSSMKISQRVNCELWTYRPRDQPTSASSSAFKFTIMIQLPKLIPWLFDERSVHIHRSKMAVYKSSGGYHQGLLLQTANLSFPLYGNYITLAHRHHL